MFLFLLIYSTLQKVRGQALWRVGRSQFWLGHRIIHDSMPKETCAAGDGIRLLSSHTETRGQT